MKVTKISLLSGIKNTMELDISLEQVLLINSGLLVQTVVPHLSVGEREFLISGITPTEWEQQFGLLDDDE